MQNQIGRSETRRIFGTQPYFTGFGAIELALLVVDIFQSG
jgi:hypothetical protein